MIGGARQRHGDLTQMRARSAELFVSLREDGISEAERAHFRDELVHLHLPLVEHFARRFLNRGEPFDDLLQVGTIGLIKAIDRFDTDRGVEFSTYATPTIVGEIKRHFRDRGWAIRVPRRLQELRLSITTATADLTQEHGRSPTISELALRIGVPGRGDHRGPGVLERLLHALPGRAGLQRRQRAVDDRRDRR